MTYLKYILFRTAYMLSIQVLRSEYSHKCIYTHIVIHAHTIQCNGTGFEIPLYTPPQFIFLPFYIIGNFCFQFRKEEMPLWVIFLFLALTRLGNLLLISFYCHPIVKRQILHQGMKIVVRMMRCWYLYFTHTRVLLLSAEKTENKKKSVLCFWGHLF